MPTATTRLGHKPTPEERKWVMVLGRIPRYKRALVWTLVDSIEKCKTKEEKDEIRQTIWACVFRKTDDLYAENIKDILFESDSEILLRAHRAHVAKNVKRIRDNLKWTQEELASRTGFPQSHISRIENAVHCCTDKTIKTLAKAMGVRASDIDLSYND